MKGTWVPHDTRNEVMDFVSRWSDSAGVPVSRFIGWLGISTSKFYHWRDRCGLANEHNGKVPRDFWLLDEEKQAIIRYHFDHPLDGYRRLAFMMLDIVHWDIRESMKEWEVEVILQRARENYPEARPRIISDNGPQFIARDFKEFIRLSGMTHVKTSPFYPQSNGKIERWHQSLKRECIRPRTPLGLDDARRIVGDYVDHYNQVRLHSAIGYVAPMEKLLGREVEIFKERDLKLEAAREERKQRRRASAIGLDNHAVACVN